MAQDRILYLRRLRIADAQDHVATAKDAVETAVQLSGVDVKEDDYPPEYKEALATLHQALHQLDGLMEGLRRS